jgi:hypothetical protein
MVFRVQYADGEFESFNISHGRQSVVWVVLVHGHLPTSDILFLDLGKQDFTLEPASTTKS